MMYASRTPVEPGTRKGISSEQRGPQSPSNREKAEEFHGCFSWATAKFSEAERRERTL